MVDCLNSLAVVAHGASIHIITAYLDKDLFKGTFEYIHRQISLVTFTIIYKNNCQINYNYIEMKIKVA